MVSAALAEKMLAWRHTGFSAHNSVRVGSRDASRSRARALHLGLWVPQTAAGRGPGPPAPDPPGPAAQILTYHPVPDIA